MSHFKDETPKGQYTFSPDHFDKIFNERMSPEQFLREVGLDVSGEPMPSDQPSSSSSSSSSSHAPNTGASQGFHTPSSPNHPTPPPPPPPQKVESDETLLDRFFSGHLDAPPPLFLSPDSPSHPTHSNQPQRLKLEHLALAKPPAQPASIVVKACIALGTGHFQKHWGEDVHRKSAEFWFKRAAALNDALALRIVALRFGHTKRLSGALLRRAAEHGDVPAMEILADELLRAGDAHAAAVCSWRASEAGSALGAYNLHVMLHNGVGVAKDEERARGFLRLAAERGLSQALWRLGQEEQSVAHIEKAARQGLGKAQLFMAKHCMKEKQPREAAEWYHRAADSDNLEAKFLLGMHYLKHELVPPPDRPVQDPIQLASDLMMDAAVKGHMDARKTIKAFSATDPHYNVFKEKGRRYKYF